MLTTHRNNARDTNAAAEPAMVTSMLGRLICGKYKILRLLGQGGMSEVYLAYSLKFQRNVALKLLRTDIPKTQAVFNRFNREAKLSLAVTHQNIVRALAVHRDKEIGRELIVLEYVDGSSLQDRLDRCGRLPIDEATHYIIQIANALECLHSQAIVHRDVKPGNILISTDGVAKLGDLGVAKVATKANDLTTAEDELGTPYYMPWEQMMNSGIVDNRSDLFALGATFYHLVTGRVPFNGDTYESILKLKEADKYVSAQELDPSLPAEIDYALKKMLAKNPKERFANAAEVAEALSMSGLKYCHLQANPQSGHHPSVSPMDVATKLDKVDPTPIDAADVTHVLRPQNPELNWMPPSQITTSTSRPIQATDYSPSWWTIAGLISAMCLFLRQLL